MPRRIDTSTEESEIPLFYKHYITGNTIVFTWLVDERDKVVKGKYLYVEQSKTNKMVRNGVLKGLRAVDDMRNELIKLGWKIHFLPKIDLTGKDAHLFSRKIQKQVAKMQKKIDKKKPVKRNAQGESFSEFKTRVTSSSTSSQNASQNASQN